MFSLNSAFRNMHILLSHCCNNGNRGRCYNTVAQMGTVAIVETYRYNIIGSHFPRIIPHRWPWIPLLPLLFISSKSDLRPQFLELFSMKLPADVTASVAWRTPCLLCASFPIDRSTISLQGVLKCDKVTHCSVPRVYVELRVWNVRCRTSSLKSSAEVWNLLTPSDEILRERLWR
jgi:hypothetical protein